MIDKQIEQRQKATFDTIRHMDGSGNEFWRARELAGALEYSEYRHFLPVVERAREACKASGRAVSDHFEDVLTMVEIGSGVRRAYDGAETRRCRTRRARADAGGDEVIRFPR